MGPGIARLLVQHYIVGRDMIGVEDGILLTQFIHPWYVLPDEV